MTITVPTLAIVLPIVALACWLWFLLTRPLFERLVLWLAHRWIGPEPVPSWQEACEYCGEMVGRHKPREFEECHRLLLAVARMGEDQ